MAGDTRHYSGFTVHRSISGCEVNVTSVNAARSLFLKKTQLRYRPLTVAVRRALRHSVMIVADGEEWRRTHDAIIPHLQASVVSRDYAPVICAMADETFNHLAARSAGAGPTPQPLDVDVERLMRIVVSRVMGHVMFGKTLSVEDAEYLEGAMNDSTRMVRDGLAAALNRVSGAALQLLRIPQHQPFLYPRAQRLAVEGLIEWIGAKIDQGNEAGAKRPIIESLGTRFDHLPPARKRRCISAECVMMFIAGIETTAATLTFAIAETARDSSVHDHVVEEARRKENDCPGADAPMIQFPYIHGVVQETLRRHTIVPTMLREAEGQIELRGNRRGTNCEEKVTIIGHSVLRYLPMQGNLRRSIWKEPFRFCPSRFAAPLTLEQNRNFNPFGLGPQSCPGRPLATVETVLVLQSFFRRLNLEKKELRKAIPVERNLLLTIRPVGVTVRVTAASAWRQP
jgi:cytochrome P450